MAIAPALAHTQTRDQTVQVTRAEPRGFTAASVRLNRETTQQSMRRLPGGRFTAIAVSVHSLLLGAYNVQRYQIVGGPPWMAVDRFDIVATLEGDPPPAPHGQPDRFQLALQVLLAERFQLRVRREVRDQDVYALVAVRPGQTGPGLRPSTRECLGSCGRQGAGHLQAESATVASLAPTLAGHVRRFVIDRTGLEGRWDIDLTFAPESTADTSAPSLFTALQEQLGLKLEPAKGPVEVLVVERLEPPVSD